MLSKEFLYNLITESIIEYLLEKKDRCYKIAKRKYNAFPSAYASGAIVRCRKGDIWKDLKEDESIEMEKDYLNETKFKKEKEEGLHGWFSRNNNKGWIDCKASKKGKLVPCGRKKAGRGADRKYPACRPTLSACNSIGVKRKKGKKTISWEKD